MITFRKILVVFSMALLLATAGCWKSEEISQTAATSTASTTKNNSGFDPANFTNQQVVSYSMGLNMGSYLSQNQFNGFDLDAVILGVKDGATNYEQRFPQERIQQAMQEVNEQLQKDQAEKAAQMAELSKAFLEDNVKNDGVITTESGLQYKPIVSVDEGEKPTATSTVTVHYRGTLIDGTEFDSSIARGEPATFTLDRVIPGWVEVLQLMKPGEKWTVVMPPELGYGENSPTPAIPANSVLIFEIELISIGDNADE